MTLLNFPESLADKYRPRRLQDFIGIPKPLAIMKALAKRPYSSAWFSLGASGVGKSSLANALALEIVGEDTTFNLHRIPSQACTVEEVVRVCEFCNYIPLNGQFHVVIVDEADRMSTAAQIAFLSILDNIPPKTIILFTANSARGLEDRFLSRCRVLIFETESLAKELPIYLGRVYKKETRHSLPLAMCEKIAADSNYNVRDALMNLEIEIILARAA